MRGLLVDLAPLRRREFRLLYLGQLVSTAGTMLTFVALPYQTYQLTGSSLIVGLLGAAEIVPTVVLALYSGMLADSVDRRRLVMAAEAGAALVALALLANSLLAEPRVWVLFVCAALGAACYALLRPPLDAMLPRLVPREEMKAALALDWIRSDVGQVVGPAVAGVLIAAAGVPVVYGLDALSFMASILLLAHMRDFGGAADAGGVSWAGIKEGWRYARSRQELVGSYVIDVNAMFFGMPIALFPAIAAGYGGAEVVGLLFAAPAVGALIASVTSGWTARVHRYGRAITLAAMGWGAAITVFGLVDVLWGALLALAVAGGMDAVSGIFRGTLWNETIPDRLRGRLAGIEMISWSSGPTLGHVRAGGVAALAGPRFSVVSGGLACVAGSVVLALLLPRFWAYDARADALTESERSGSVSG